MNYLKLNNENSNGAVKLIVDALVQGGIVLLPFDTVYGFIADPKNEVAIEKIFQLKGRNKKKTLGLAVSGLDQLEKIATADNLKFLEGKIPGKFTFILNARGDQLSKFCYQSKTIGIRVPDNQIILETTKMFGPVAQTSANKSGHKSCCSIDQIRNQFKKEMDQLDLIIDGGEIVGAKASEIWDLTGGVAKRIER